jgi:chromosome segregation ATPase
MNNGENIIELLEGLSAKLDEESQKDQTFRTNIKNDLTTLNDDILKINAELSSVLAQIKSIENNINQNSELVNELQGKLTILEAQKDQIQKRLDEVTDDKQNIEIQLGEQKVVVQEKEDDITRLTAEKAAAEAEYKTAFESLAKGNTTQQEMSAQIEKLGKEHDVAIAGLTKEITYKSTEINSLKQQILEKDQAHATLQTELNLIKEENKTNETSQRESLENITNLETDNGRMRSILENIYPLIQQLSNKFEDIAKQKPVEMESLMQLVTPIKDGLKNTKKMIRDFQNQNQLALADIKLQADTSGLQRDNALAIGKEKAGNDLREKLQRRNATRLNSNTPTDETEIILGDEPNPTLGGRSTRRRHKKTKTSHRKKGGRKTKKSYRHKQKSARKKK